MGLTITEKCIKKSIVAGDWQQRGSRIGLRAHQTLGYDVNAVMTFLALDQLGIDRVKTEVSVQYIDHNMLQADYKNADDHLFLEQMCAKYGVICARPGSGICHQLHLEYFGVPGKTLIGGDSHTPAQGGLGMLGIGVGGFDAALAMAGHPVYLAMPQVVNVHLSGQLPPLVSAKNVILAVLQKIGVKGAVGKVLEYTGPGVATLSVTERSTITNMSTETGATSAIFPSDDTTKAWLAAHDRQADWIALAADDDARYDARLDIALDQLEPLIALPHSPGQVVPVAEVAGIKLDQVMLGSCTNTALPDVLQMAAMFKNQRVASHVDAALYPSTRTVIKAALKAGAFGALVDAGVRIFEPSCGGCNGCGFAPQSHGVSLRTTPRNFAGRSGTADDQVYLSAPEVAVASAITGVITDPRTLAWEPAEYSVPTHFERPANLFIVPEPVTTVTYGPNLLPLPQFGQHAAKLGGEVLLKLPDNVTTDDICPAGALYLPIRSNIPAISKHSFQTIDPTFYQRARDAAGGVLVAGNNYGQGSSREQAAIIPRYLRIAVIIAKGFARLHLANLVNWGVVPLIFADANDYAKIHAGDQLQVALAQFEAEPTVTVTNLTQNTTFTAKTPLGKADRHTVMVGGKLNAIKESEAQTCD
ncbi:aconitate hydratase [Lacticaseibacillus baoqingensis]|uniref:aconitate hydratase n=1 Tax=Lacticaseibacillus baoqingensis TaxID=2486013 RepID=A0ABW4E8W2_9LACO|nr:aconitate hydratase [Lacticaseibacillus baoqingensis]